ncbi:hypothetical protein CTEN210_15763 [Chaetoceros tenuissimus]|uniref:Anaphase-promoting complex subunit 5 n=1 Tax=Chaetoceros tenuissimus TaxID=426638 RepID=A0AAD3D8C0_9STRA|nr:hypothetical protein CTEN210_15763 [Chaetoceros tenuissimus]
MASRPTPVSIGICTLIALYSVPSSQIYTCSKDEGIGDHLSLVIKQLIFNDGTVDAVTGDSNDVGGINNAIETMSLSKLLCIVAGGDFKFKKSAAFLLQDLQHSVSSIDALMDLFSALNDQVGKRVIDGESAHGIYVRKRCLGFERLGFDSVGRFWESCVDFVDNAENWDSASNISSFASDNEQQSSSNWPLDSNQISKVMLNQCRQLDEEIDSYNFQELESQLQDVLRENPELTLVHFLRFLNCANNGEVVGALEHFHRYFDYAMIEDRRQRLAMPVLPEEGNGDNNTNNNNPNSNQSGTDGASDGRNKRKANVVAYVSVVLAALFHKLGFHEMSKIASQEAIKVAQQSGDDACLAYALGWLNATTASMDSAAREQIKALERAAARGGRLNISSLVSGNALLQANRQLSSEVTTNHSDPLENDNMTAAFDPSETWDSLANASSSRSNVVNTIGGTVYSNDIPTSLPNIYRDGGTSQVFAKQKLIGSNLWHSIGRSKMASATSKVALHCYDMQLSSEDEANFASEICSSVLFGTGILETTLNDDDIALSDDDMCARLESLKKKRGEPKKTRKSKCPNLYSKAIDKIKRAQAKSAKANSIHWNRAVLEICIESSIRSNSLHEAEGFVNLLNSLSLARDGPKATVRAMGLCCLLLHKKEKFHEAEGLIISSILPLCEKHCLHYLKCHFLLNLAFMKIETSKDDPTIALPSLLDCLSFSEEHSIDSIHASALSLLAKVFLEMGDFKKARSIIKAALPVLLEHGHILYQGQAWLTLAKCTLSELKDLETNEDDDLKLSLRKHAFSDLQKATSLIEQINDVNLLQEIYYLTAHTCSSIPGQRGSRDAASKAFLDLQKKKNDTLIPTVYDLLDAIRC